MDIYQEILAALQTDERVMLATIISASGSTPAAAFSKMLVKQNGIVSIGTVGGGCMEGDVLLHANRLLQTGAAEILTFHLNEDDVEHGLICGGSLDVLIEPITRKQLQFFTELQSIRNEGSDCVVVTALNRNGTIERKEIIHTELHVPSHFSSEAAEVIPKSFKRQETFRLKTENGELIIEPVVGTPSLITFGGGHVSKYISRTAAMAGFRVTIIDDREKFANKLRFPEAVQTIAADFLEAFSQLTITSSTYIVIVTRGHRYDEEILERAVATPAKYIGMIGSKRKVIKTFEYLAERDIPIESMKRVHAPIGIEIGAVTAEEIGVSVVAELINARRGKHGTLHHKSDDMKDIFQLLQQRITA